MIEPEQLDFDSLMFGKDRRVLMVGEVADKLRVSAQHVLDLIAEGKLRAVNIAAGSDREHWRIPVESYHAFIASQDSFKL